MNPHGTIYDEKHYRIATRPQWGGWCEECKRHGGHTTICSQCTPEWMAYLATHAQDQEARARKYAAQCLSALKMMHGKVALLRHENNKLRKANERLRAGKEPEQKERE
jgi:hypothetical protein